MGSLCGSQSNKKPSNTTIIQNKKQFDKAQTLSTNNNIQRLLNQDPFECILDRALGMVIGAAIGDSIGSFCEFSYSRLTVNQLDNAMQMPGGGPHFISSGQVTDDTELSIQLARALISMENSIFDVKAIANFYDEWLCSNPFDVGTCTHFTLSEAPNVNKMKIAAKTFNNNNISKGGNMSNGSLMRIHPLIIYGYKLSQKQFEQIIIEECSLTHYNKYVFYCNISYGIAVKYLLLNYDEEDRNYNAFKAAEEWLINKYNEDKNNKIAHDVLQWLLICKKMETKLLHSATKQIGFIKIAFQKSFYNLWKSKDITCVMDAIKSTVFEGGDTDTNGCIVGGMMGCWFGFHSIPKYYVDKIKSCKPVKDRDEYQAKVYFEENLVMELLKCAPNDIK
eukprot:513228_1